MLTKLLVGLAVRVDEDVRMVTFVGYSTSTELALKPHHYLACMNTLWGMRKGRTLFVRMYRPGLYRHLQSLHLDVAASTHSLI